MNTGTLEPDALFDFTLPALLASPHALIELQRREVGPRDIHSLDSSNTDYWQGLLFRDQIV